MDWTERRAASGTEVLGSLRTPYQPQNELSSSYYASGFALSWIATCLPTLPLCPSLLFSTYYTYLFYPAAKRVRSIVTVLLTRGRLLLSLYSVLSFRSI